MTEELPRLDTAPHLREQLLPHCRLTKGEVWVDPLGKHIVAVGDARDGTLLDELSQTLARTNSENLEQKPTLMVSDPPYNFSIGGKSSASLFETNPKSYTDFTRAWVQAALPVLSQHANLYIWIGADQKNGFQPLPEIMMLMREFNELESRSFITMRNQRGYGTQKNWMSVRQELLYYRKGRPKFQPQYTDIPRLLQGYYKQEEGKRSSNGQRSKNPNIRPGNVWVDIQQVFYRMKENVPGSYAQKPLKAIERVILSSSSPGDMLIDQFSHSGTGLLAAERSGRRCIALDIDPIFAEISIRRLERYRNSGSCGWQWGTPFPEVKID